MSEQGEREVFIAPIRLAELSRHRGVEQTETGPVCRKYVTETGVWSEVRCELVI